MRDKVDRRAPVCLHIINGSRRDRVAAVAVMWGFW